jgi:hypothetical protein
MYKEDVDTAHVIMEIKDKYSYPVLFSGSTGKNKTQRIIEVASILKGTLVVGASMQSNDPEVLKAIKRSNISIEAYKELISFGNSLENSKTHTEFILGLPGDTKEKHFNCLRFGVENNVNNVRMYQAMLLAGTDMATPWTREHYGLITKFRTIPGCIGIYHFFGEDHPIAEIEEIIVGSKSMPVEDYIDCRIMNLIIETFHNNAIFDELFAAVRAMGHSSFDCLLYLKEHPELYSDRVKEIIAEFVKQTSKDLYDSFKEANNYVLTPEVIERYIGGELGINELLVHRAFLFSEFEDISNLMFRSVKETLRAKGVLNQKIEQYLNDLKDFTISRKADIFKDVDMNTKRHFRYDFGVIKEQNYEIDPNAFPVLDEPVEFSFFHDDKQKAHIANQVKLYANTPSGLGRLLQRSNLKLMYRKFKKCTESIGGEHHLAREKLEV